MRFWVLTLSQQVGPAEFTGCHSVPEGRNPVWSRVLTPSQQVVPQQMLFLCEHGHHDECVQVDALTQHPEVVTRHQVEVDEHDHLTAHLGEGHNQSEPL